MIEQKPKIAIVDDEVFQLTLVSEVLAKYEYETVCFDCPAKALEAIQNDPEINILITDIFMPEIDGLELMEMAMGVNPDLVTIVITGNKDVEYAVDSIRRGASDFLQKPLNMNKLIAAVKNAMDLLSNEVENLHDTTYCVSHVNHNVIGKYELIGRVGKGANGMVYLAKKKNDPQDYAIKVMNPVPDKKEREMIKKRFKNEGKALALIDHPNIIKCFEYGVLERLDEEYPYIVMEYFPSNTLKYFLQDTNHFELEDKIKIIAKVAEGLGAVHEQNIFHRDIKPANILVSDNLEVKITDFGVCHLPLSDLTSNDTALGSPYYFAPEQLSSENISQSVDIFSLGVVSYELFLGIRPFNAKLFHVLVNKIVNEYPVEPKLLNEDFPQDLQNILAKMLKKNPKYRYQHTSEIIRDLTDFLHHTSHSSIYDKLKHIVMFQKDWAKSADNDE